MKMIIVNLRTWCAKAIDCYDYSPHDLNKIYEFYDSQKDIWIGYEKAN